MFGMKTAASAAVAFACIVLLSATAPVISAVTTCSGLISLAPSLLRWSPSQLDISDITLTLRTKSGLRKETVHCAPNGFYIVPIYESGTFILEAHHPQGWTLSPAEYQFTVIDGTVGIDDLNFRIQGFPVHGSVTVPALGTCADRRQPAAAVVLNVQSVTNTTMKAVSVGADNAGRVVVGGLAPGQYQVTGRHKGGRQVRPDAVTHTVSWGASRLPPLVLEGATVSGVVAAVPADIGLSMYLIPRGGSITGNCPDQNGSCYSAVTADGAFHFENVPCGAYTLRAQMAESAARYVLNVDHVDIEVGFDDVDIGAGTFTVVAVSIQGEVRDESTGDPIEGAAILVDDVEVALSDPQGRFIWDASDLGRSGPYHIQAKKAGVRFDTVAPFYLGHAGPRIKATSYDVCGFVQLPDAATAADYSIEVLAGSSIIASVPLDQDGTFCYAAAPGLYEIRPVSGRGPLSPLSRSVRVQHALVENVAFYPLTVSVHAFVTCFHRSDCEGVLVTMDKIGQRIALSNVTSADGAVQFADLAPGQYRVEARKQNLCFDPVQVEVGEHDLSNVVVQQKGVRVSVTSPIATDVDLVDTVLNSVSRVQIPAGSPHSICVPSADLDLFQLRSPANSAVRFRNEPVAASETVALALAQVEVVGEIQVPVNLAATMDVEAVADHETRTVTAAVVAQDDQLATLQYQFWADVSKTYTIGVATSSDLVFDPAHVQVTILEKPATVPVRCAPIRGRAGLFRSGKISPPVPGAKATARSSEYGSTLTMIVTHDEYRFGPLLDAAEYRIDIEHPDYQFEPVGNGDFRAIRLLSIQVAVRDEVSGEPVEGVLVSLSGPAYRNNSLSAADGVVAFTGLVPGQYFLFLVMKEFVFTPPSQTIVLAESDIASNYTVSAKRTRYSVFGSVKSIVGNGVGNVVVSASTTDGEYVEETVSDASGFYRIRGLSSGTTYDVSVRALEADAIERSVPETRTVTMPVGDVRDVDFICFRRPSYGEVFGTLPAGSMPTIIELRHRETGQLEKSISCSPSKRFFNLYGVPFGSYVMTAETKDLEMEPIVVDVASRTKVKFEAKAAPAKDTFDEGPETSIFTIVIGFMLIIAVINYETLQSSVKKWNGKRNSRQLSAQLSWETSLDHKKRISLSRKSRR